MTLANFAVIRRGIISSFGYIMHSLELGYRHQHLDLAFVDESSNDAEIPSLDFEYKYPPCLYRTQETGIFSRSLLQNYLLVSLSEVDIWLTMYRWQRNEEYIEELLRENGMEERERISKRRQAGGYFRLCPSLSTILENRLK